MDNHLNFPVAFFDSQLAFVQINLIGPFLGPLELKYKFLLTAPTELNDG
jgi:hypothetical protein